MTRLLVTSLAAVGLILFVTFVAARLIRSRTRGFSVRMQVFLALAFIVGGFSFGLGLLVVDRVEARAVRLARAAAAEEARMVAAILSSELERTDADFERVASDFESRKLHQRPTGAETLGVELLDLRGLRVFPLGATSRAFEPGAVFEDFPVRAEGQVVGTVRVVKPTIVVQAMLADFAPTVLVISLLLGAVAALAAAWIGRTIAAPIEGLSRYAEEVAAGRRAGLALRPAGREVQRLVTSLDQMRRQLEGRPFVETFAADLSHELKNPVAAIRASAEVLEDGALEEPHEAARFVGRIREAAARIERLLGELLDLARLESRGAESTKKHELDALVREVSEALPDAARISLDLPERVFVRGDRAWLARAIVNLLDNALLHSSERVKVSLRQNATIASVVLGVENEGQVATHVRAEVFRRFITTRGDRGGTGLGLSIVRAVAEAHGGRVELVEAGPPKVVFELWLPAA